MERSRLILGEHEHHRETRKPRLVLLALVLTSKISPVVRERLKTFSFWA